MSEKNIAPGTDAAESAAEVSGEEEFLYVPDYTTSDADSSDDEQEVFARINARECNIEEYVMPDMNLWQKMGEFWYRNKGMILAGIGAAVVLAFLIITGLPDSYDLTSTIYVSYSDFPSTISFEMIDELEEHVEDWDRSGDIEVAVSIINLVDGNGIIAAANMEKLLLHINEKPTSMLWIVDEDLYSMMIRDYGEYLFESYEGAPLWIEITSNDIINSCIERSECPRLGFCLRALTDELAKDEDVCAAYERALLTLADIKAEHPEMFGEE